MNAFQNTPLDELVERWIPLLYGVVSAAGAYDNPGATKMAVFGDSSAKSIAAFMAASSPHIEEVDFSLLGHVGSAMDRFLETEELDPHILQSLKHDLIWQKNALSGVHDSMSENFFLQSDQTVIGNWIVPFNAALGLIDAMSVMNEQPDKDVQLRALRSRIYPMTDMVSLIDDIYKRGLEDSPSASH